MDWVCVLWSLSEFAVEVCAYCSWLKYPLKEAAISKAFVYLNVAVEGTVSKEPVPMNIAHWYTSKFFHFSVSNTVLLSAIDETMIQNDIYDPQTMR